MRRPGPAGEVPRICRSVWLRVVILRLKSMCLCSGTHNLVVTELEVINGEVERVVCVCAPACLQQNVTHSSQKFFLPRLLVNLPSPSFPEGELLAHRAVKNQEMKRGCWGRWGFGGGGVWPNPAQTPHLLGMNEMVGGEAAKCSPGRRCRAPGRGEPAWDLQTGARGPGPGEASEAPSCRRSSAGCKKRSAMPLPSDQSSSGRSDASLSRDARSRRASSAQWPFGVGNGKAPGLKDSCLGSS